MKIQCDVCGLIEASFFCTADEAALCDSCDHGVHNANKLASTHSRFSLLPPFPNYPLCDICQEKRAILFCQQDRAILCSDCDAPIHSANVFTQKHDRFLLTGVKVVSATSSRDMLPCVTTESTADPPVHQKENPSQSWSNMDFLPPSNAELSMSRDDMILVPGTNYLTSNIRTDHYLAETFLGLPAVDDFPCPSSSQFCFSMVKDHGGVLQGTDTDWIREKKCLSSETMAISVPERTSMSPSQKFSEMGWQSGNMESNDTRTLKANLLWTMEDEFSVPQIDSSPTFSRNYLSPW